MKTVKIACLLALAFSVACAQKPTLQKTETNTNSSIRALSVVDNHVAWVGATKGTIGKTTDGGKTWKFSTVPAMENTDFRSVYGFDSLQAVIANAGSPASILRTADGGKSWAKVYVNAHPDAFFDGIDFWNDKEGIIYGDPIDQKMLLLKTSDGGLTWNELVRPPVLEKGEASFAASGTGIRCYDSNTIMICTRGVVSRLWTSDDKGMSWRNIQTPILQGESSTGIFSFAKQHNTIIVVGGNYLKENETEKHHLFSADNGNTWRAPMTASHGYRECVEFIDSKTLITTGPSGSEISFDKGINWQPLSDIKGLHVIRKARKGNLILAAGAGGQIYIVQ